MADKSPRLNLDRYEQGDTDWDHTDLVNAVDELAIDRGPIAERPASGDYDDQMYHAVDQEILWRWDADAADWTAVSGRGSANQPLPGTVHRESVSTGEVYSDKIVGGQRLQAVYDANEIRSQAGVPSAVRVGPEAGVSPGLSDAGLLSSSSAITIASESDASSAAASGSGTESDPYVIQDKDITGANSPGIDWIDSDASYHIKVENCVIHDNNPTNGYTGNLRVEAPTSIVVSNCLLYDTGGTRLIRLDDDDLDATLNQTKFEGTGGNWAISGDSANSLEMVNCSFDENQSEYNNTVINAIQIEEYIDIHKTLIDGGVRAVVHSDLTPIWNMDRVEVRNADYGFYHGMGSDANEPGRGSTWEHCDFNTTNDSFYVVGGTAGEYEISHSRFVSEQDRAVFLDRDTNTGQFGLAKGWDIHHCSVETDPSTGKEGIEPWYAQDVTIRNCYCTACGDDAFEFVEVVRDCNTEYLVGDNISESLVDYFNAAPPGKTPNDLTQDYDVGKSRISHIFGTYGLSHSVNGITVASMDGLLVSHIFVDGPNAAVRFDSEGIGHMPDNNRVYGPLPLAESVDAIVEFEQELNNIAVYFDGEQIKTVGSPPSEWTAIR